MDGGDVFAVGSVGDAGLDGFGAPVEGALGPGVFWRPCTADFGLEMGGDGEWGFLGELAGGCDGALVQDGVDVGCGVLSPCRCSQSLEGCDT